MGQTGSYGLSALYVGGMTFIDRNCSGAKDWAGSGTLVPHLHLRDEFEENHGKLQSEWSEN